MDRQWLINIRLTANKSQEDVAQQAGITRQYYGMIEGGERNPSVKAAKAIASVLKFKWTIFFDSKGNESLQKDSVTTA